jgi:hypothetical protein
MAVCTSPGFCALPSGMFSAAQTMAMTRTLGLSRAMARMAPSMAAPPAMSYFIFSILSAGLMEMPPVSKVMPLPTRPRTGRRSRLPAHSAERSGRAARPSPARRSRMRPSSARAAFRWSGPPSRGRLPGHLAARWPRMVGVSLLPGSLTSERVKFWLSPMMTPSAKAASRAAWSADWRRGER